MGDDDDEGDDSGKPFFLFGVCKTTTVGAGKTEEIVAAVNALRAETVIFDDELSSAQGRNIEKLFKKKGIRVGDRTALILDIFSQRAATKEGQLQARKKKRRAQGEHTHTHTPCRFPLCAVLRWKWRGSNTKCRGSRGCGRTWNDRAEEERSRAWVKSSWKSTSACCESV